jgi:hypothetical protein
LRVGEPGEEVFARCGLGPFEYSAHSGENEFYGGRVGREEIAVVGYKIIFLLGKVEARRLVFVARELVKDDGEEVNGVDTGLQGFYCLSDQVITVGGAGHRLSWCWGGNLKK